MKKLLAIIALLLVPVLSSATMIDLEKGVITKSHALERETRQFRHLPGGNLPQSDIATINTYIRAIKYGPGVTLSSITGKWDVTAASPFGTGFSQDLRWLAFLACQLSVSDGTNAATMRPTLNGFGMGETYDTAVFADTCATDGTAAWASVDTLTWDTDHYVLTRNGTNGRIRNSVDYAALTAGRLYRVIATVKDGTVAGASMAYTITDGAGTVQETQSFTLTNTWTNHSMYGTANGTGVRTQYLIAASINGNVLIKLTSTNRVLTPDTTGFTAGTLSLGSFNANTFATTGGSITVTRL